MASDAQRFAAFVAVSLVVLIAILRFVTRDRTARPRISLVLSVAGIVAAGGMLFAKFGNNAGLPWWIYYTVPALITLALPPVVFAFSRKELAWYLVLAFSSSPAIHLAFSLFGWPEYMPFIPVPSFQEMFASAQADV